MDEQLWHKSSVTKSEWKNNIWYYDNHQICYNAIIFQYNIQTLLCRHLRKQPMEMQLWHKSSVTKSEWKNNIWYYDNHQICYNAIIFQYNIQTLLCRHLRKQPMEMQLWRKQFNWNIRRRISDRQRHTTSHWAAIWGFGWQLRTRLVHSRTVNLFWSCWLTKGRRACAIVQFSQNSKLFEFSFTLH